MSPAGCRAFFAFAVCGLLPALTSAAGQGDSPVPIDFSVLTPAIEGRFVVASGFDFTSLLPPAYLALGEMGNSQRTTQLRSILAREHYDPARTIADRLIEALAEAGYGAEHEPIARKPAGSLQSLSWSDLPEEPRGELMLDVTVRSICLCSEIAFAKFYPAISLGWRLLDPAQEVVEPTRTISYHHFPPATRKKQQRATTVGAKPVPQYPPVAVSDNCGFSSVKEAEKNPQVLLGCFGEAYDAALRRLVIDLQEVHPPRPAVTASTDTPS